MTEGGGAPNGGDDDATRAAVEAGRKFFAQECRFVAGASRSDVLPPDDLPEVAFAGRSNVGKSSLINALTGRRTLARISRTPGRTQQINFFTLGRRLMLVDLPGYGYARASKTQIKSWTALVDAYLQGRGALRRAYVLIDSRHGLKDSDRAVMAMLDTAAVSYQAVLTKADKTRPEALEALIEELAADLAGHAAAYPEIAVTSARTGAGIVGLRADVAALAAPGQLR